MKIRPRRALALSCVFVLGFASPAQPIPTQQSPAQRIATGKAGQPTKLHDKSVVRSVHLRFDDPRWWTRLHENRAAENYLSADLTIGRRTYRAVGVRIRGRSSYFVPNKKQLTKLPFRISMDAFVPGQRLFGHRSLVLNNGFGDPTFMREALAMEFLGEFIHTPQVNWIQLFINGKYWGVYINVEAPNRDYLASRFVDPRGDRYQGNAVFRFRGHGPAAYETVHPIVSNARSGAHRDLAAAIATLAIPDTATRIREMHQQIDTDTALRLLAGNAVLANPDAFPKRNYYIYADPFHRRLSFLNWDANFAWASVQPIPARPALFADSEDWVRRYRTYVRVIARRMADPARIAAFVERHQARIDNAVKADANRLYSYADFHRNLNETVNADGPVLGLYPAAAAMAKAVREAPGFGESIPALTPHQPTPAQPTWRDPITFRVSVTATGGVASVHVHHRIRGAFTHTPLSDDGQHGDQTAGDGVFTGRIPPYRAGSRVQYYFTARTLGGQGGVLALSPECGEHDPFEIAVAPRRDSVLIHEIVAKNRAGLRDADGHHRDWIELINPLDRPVDIGGMHLTDDRARPWRHAFPSGTILQPHATLIVWADGQPERGPLHLPFKLSARGDTLALFDADGETLLDALSFGKQRKDVSTGRLGPTAHDEWVAFPRPSPHSPNNAMPDGWRAFTALDPRKHTASIALARQLLPQRGDALHLAGAVPEGGFFVVLGGRPDHATLPWPGLALLVHPGPVVVVSVAADADGRAIMPLPNGLRRGSEPRSARLVVQAFTVNDTVRASNGLEFLIR